MTDPTITNYANGIDCDGCGDRIRVNGEHFTTGTAIRCGECFADPGQHDRAFPACEMPDHRLHNHPHGIGQSVALRVVARRAREAAL